MIHFNYYGYGSNHFSPFRYLGVKSRWPNLDKSNTSSVHSSQIFLNQFTSKRRWHCRLRHGNVPHKCKWVPGRTHPHSADLISSRISRHHTRHILPLDNIRNCIGRNKMYPPQLHLNPKVYFDSCAVEILFSNSWHRFTSMFKFAPTSPSMYPCPRWMQSFLSIWKLNSELGQAQTYSVV